jgi:predicted DNA-binding transcriptional regulator YafY
MTLPELSQRMVRLIDEIQYLRENERVTITQLAGYLSIPQEEIINDLQDLNKAGVPVVMAQDGCTILPSFQESIGLFEMDESFHLLQGLHLWYEQGSIPEEKFIALQNKIISAMPPGVIQQMKKMQSATTAPVKNPVDPKCMEFVQSAICNKQRIAMQYQSRQDSKPAWRELSPFSMVYRKSAWYVIGYCHRRNETRTFKLNRIHQCKLSGHPYHDDPDFDLNDYLLYTWNIIGGEPQLVIIRFSGDAKKIILEKQISNGRVWKENGFVYLKTIVAGLDEIGWWVMQYGEMAEVLQPEDLRTWLGTRAVKMANQYKNTIKSKHRGKKIIPLFS